MSEWKEGDKGIVIKNSYDGFKVGTEVTYEQDIREGFGEFKGIWKGHNMELQHPFSDIKKLEDSVQKPPHYNQGEVECIDALRSALTPAEFRGYLKGNTMKYLWRMGLKGSPLVDVQKAQWYLNKLVEDLEK